MAKKIAVRIKYNGIIPLLCCYGPIKRIVLPQADVETITKMLGEEYVEVLTPKKQVKVAPKQDVEPTPVVEEKKEEVVEAPVVEEVIETPIVEEIIVEKKEEVVEEQPKRRGRKPAAAVKEEE